MKRGTWLLTMRITNPFCALSGQAEREETSETTNVQKQQSQRPGRTTPGEKHS